MKTDPRYFILRNEGGDGYCAIYKMPDTMPDMHKPSEGLRMGHTFPTGLKFRMTKEVSGMRIADVIENALGYIMVSARMKALLEQHADADIEFLRFTLLNHKGRVASDECYIANLLGTQDCVDMARSEGDLDALEPGRFFFLTRLVLDSGKIDPKVKLFRAVAAPELMIVREDLKERFEKEGISGATFVEVGSEVSFTL